MEWAPPGMSVTMASKRLAVYLNDHLAGATGGVDLARRIETEALGTAAGPFVVGLADDIEADRGALQDLMADLGVEEHWAKQAAGWAAEKLGRLKMNQAVMGSAELALLVSMETLAAGVEAKRGLWQSLLVLAADGNGAFAGVDLNVWLKRAVGQIECLEQARLAIAGPALRADLG